MKLGDVFKLSSGKSLPEKKRTSGKHNVYGGNGIAGNHNDYFVEKPTIVIGRVGEYCGAVHLTTEKCWITDNALMVTEWYQEVDKQYLVYVLNAKNLHQYAKTVGQPSISQANVYGLDINLPLMEQQQEIVKILNLVSKIIIDRKEELKRLDNLIKTRFVELFYDKGYPILKWNNVFNTTTGKLDSNAAVEDGEYPFFTCSKEILRIDKYAFEQEALLLAGNNAAGKYDVKYYNGKFNAYQRTYVLDLKEDWSYRLFQYQLEDKLVYLQQQSLGGLTKYLTLKILGELEFIIPPMDKQDEFTHFVEQVDKSKIVVQKSLEETQKLFDSLMQKYFG